MSAITVVSGFANIMATPDQIKSGSQEKAVTVTEHKGLYRLKHMPRGGAMQLYGATVLKVLGGFTKERKTVNPDEAVKFFQTSRQLDQWVDCKVLEEVKGGIRLTKGGYEYLTGILFGADKIKNSNLAEMARLEQGMTQGSVPKESRTKLFRGVGFIPAK